MKYKRISIAVITGLLMFGPGPAKSSGDHNLFGEVRIIALSPETILNQYSTPVIAPTGDIGFISSVTTGSLISFSVTSGKVLSSITFGKTVGLVSLIESGKKRLIALPAANGPDHPGPATVNIINATSPDRPERIALIELPAGIPIGPDTRALLTSDGRFGVIAAGHNQPTLFSFSLETGKIISSLQLSGLPSAITLYDGAKDKKNSWVAVVSAEANALHIINLDIQGRLSAGKDFNPVSMRLDASNNPAFSADGQVLYLAVLNGEHVFSIDTQKGTLLGMIKLPSAPQQITVASDRAGGDLIGVVRASQPQNKKSCGVTILASNKGQLSIRTEFTLPENIQLSGANNIVFDSDVTTAYIGSADGTLFAFHTKTGEIAAHKVIGNEFRGLILSKNSRALIAVRSTPKNDEIAIIRLDQVRENRVETQASASSAPEIKRVSSSPAQISLVIEGTNFDKESVIEFVKAGNVVSRHVPIVATDKKLAIVVPARRFEALGEFELRVVAPDKSQSNPVKIDPAALLSGTHLDAPPAAAEPPQKASITKVEPSRPPKEEPSRTASALHAVRAEVVDGILRVYLNTKGEARFKDFTLSSPPRIIVDLQGLTNAYGNRTIQVGKGSFERVRIGQPSPGVVRIVIDMTKTIPYKVRREPGSLVITVGN